MTDTLRGAAPHYRDSRSVATSVASQPPQQLPIRLVRTLVIVPQSAREAQGSLHGTQVRIGIHRRATVRVDLEMEVRRTR